MSDLNDAQRDIAETLDGMMVVDAGPGTGKTHTIVRRYINLISREDVRPEEVLMLTFTRNAATEMEERIKGVLASEGRLDDSKHVRVKTFDAFCMSVVMESPELAGWLFGIEESLSHSATLVENDTLNKAFFSEFLDSFLESNGTDYGIWGPVASQNPLQLYDLICRLMSRGIYPLRRGWFGNEGNDLEGDMAALLAILREMNVLRKRQKRSTLMSGFFPNEKVLDVNAYDPLPRGLDAEVLRDNDIRDAVEDDRSEMLGFIHDVYREFIRRCIVEDRLTFGVTAMLAFSILYGNEEVRRLNSYRYIMIDEFQDTNASQLMMALMILREPNLCVVGDWKQGIYGFRFVSVENILHFDERCRVLRGRLNDDGVRIRFEIPTSAKKALVTNYRSSQLIVDEAFRCPLLHGSKEEVLDQAAIEGSLVRLTAHRDGEIDGRTAVRYVNCASKDDEPGMVAAAIRDYVGSGRYQVVENGVARPMRFGDIAVLCRKGVGCRRVMEHLAGEGIPAFLQGDVEIMATREGKLTLAWLRYMGNEYDPWGLVPIMSDMGYSMAEIKAAVTDKGRVPYEIAAQRRLLLKKRRRVTDLLTSIFSWYGLDNDITQSIISVLSSAHRDSLLTISDLVSIIESDIGSNTTYPVDSDIGGDAVTVMTMHKSKGLEFPAVIIPYVDLRTMPSTRGNTSVFRFSPLTGVRCTQTVADFDGYEKLCKSWRTRLVNLAEGIDYDEERRLMFVAMSRAKQYVTVISGSPSNFMKELAGDACEQIPQAEIPESSTDDGVIERPDLSGYERRTPRYAVHDIMRIDPGDGQGGMSDADEAGFKGMAYGTDVHEEAQMLERGVPPSGKFPESEFILSDVLSRRESDGFIRSYTEIECTLPLLDGEVLMKGTIDLLMVFEDHVEVHDYKTDETDRFQSEYEIQLSVYAQAASRFYSGLPVRCFIDYVSQRKVREVVPMSLEALEGIARERLPSP